MLHGQILQQNINLYLVKMEQKFKEGQQKIKSLQNHINKSAQKIQRCFKQYIYYKKVKAARMIQHFWKSINKQIKYQRKVFLRCKKTIASMKIYNFFIRLRSQKIQHNNNKRKEMTKNSKLSISITRNIKNHIKRYCILYSSIRSQMSYINKYLAYDKLTFTRTWQIYEGKQLKWIWQQIKKKWTKKDDKIWINDNQKQINAQNYTYNKEYQRFQLSQQRLKIKSHQLKNNLKGLQKAYLDSLIK